MDCRSEKSEDACEGDANPGGTIVEFVEELVEGFFEEVGVEQELSLAGCGMRLGVCFR